MEESPFRIETDRSAGDANVKLQTPTGDPQADRRARQRVKLPGRAMVTAGLLGMILPLINLLAAGIELSQQITWESRLKPFAVIGISLVGLVWYSVAIYGGVLLTERRKAGLVMLGCVLLLIGAVTELLLAPRYYPLHIINILFTLIISVLVWRALRDTDVQTAIRQRRAGRS